MRGLTVSLAFVALFGMAVATAQATDPFVGTWKLDVVKSQFPGPAPKSVTVTVERMGDARKVAVDSVDSADARLAWGYTSSLDGKEASVMGNPAYDTVSGTEKSPREVVVTYKKDGKMVATLNSVVSADGKMLTITTTPAGDMAKSTVQVYTRQPTS